MVYEKTRKIVSEQLGRDIEDIHLETNIKEDLNADSLEVFQIVNDLEDEFGVEIADAEEIRTIADAVKFIEDRLK